MADKVIKPRPKLTQADAQAIKSKHKSVMDAIDELLREKGSE